MVKIIPQLNVYLPNEPGVLCKLTEVLHKSKVNIVGMCITEATEWGVLRLIVDKPGEAKRIVKRITGKASINSILEITLPNVPGALKNVTKRLARKNINVNYAYATGRGDKTTLFLSVDDVEKARKVLDKNF